LLAESGYVNLKIGSGAFAALPRLPDAD
jgi:hypothetical protein